MSWELDRGRQLFDAARATVVYADLFDFAIDEAELHRDLVYVDSNAEETASAVRRAIAADLLASRDGYLTLPDRGQLVEVRRRRRRRAAALWSTAREYGRLFAAIPFVRMVGVTGSLAANNPLDEADVDYMLVSTPGRLWLVRAAAIAVVRLARRRKASLCPNYLLSMRALTLTSRDLYTAHEVLQLVPVFGGDAYRTLVTRNEWIGGFLPNWAREPVDLPRETQLPRFARSIGERALAGPIGDRINNWEEHRKVSRFRVVDASATFNQDVCEGHFRGHREQVLTAFSGRCAALGIDLASLESSAREPGTAASGSRLELVG